MLCGTKKPGIRLSRAFANYRVLGLKAFPFYQTRIRRAAGALPPPIIFVQIYLPHIGLQVTEITT